MFKTINAGKTFGIPVSIHWSLTALFLGLGLYGFYEGGVAQAAESVGLWLIVFVSVFFHELGHVAAAKQFGITAVSITLSCIGGSANFATPLDRPLARFVISLAGPLVNVLFAIASFIALLAIHPTFEVKSIFTLEGFLIATIALNVVLFCFNMLPIYPLDGGQIMRALFSSVLSTENAKRVTFVMTVLGAIALAVYGFSEKSWITVGFSIFLLLTSYLELGRGLKRLQNAISSMRTKEAVAQMLDIQSKGFDRELVAKAVVPSKIPGQFVAFDADGRDFAYAAHWAGYESVDDRISQMKVILAHMKTAKRVGGAFRWVSQYELEEFAKAKREAEPSVG
ncbi:site-2 protease family protein [Mesorhizobium sp. SP-1A]|uniref:site-2 protease family protein n=1 Tax=Mesorhizobium sp. SP-1A TaxID=3077840 RepID=UPI0028F6E522|nr:site-2 protease family protein [Mesorhizobium sp. SP-1A]